jgi:hypothetical protein
MLLGSGVFEVAGRMPGLVCKNYIGLPGAPWGEHLLQPTSRTNPETHCQLTTLTEDITLSFPQTQSEHIFPCS